MFAMYFLKAGHLAWQMWTETFDDDFFWWAVFNLQSGLRKSPSNYDFKFLLVKFFNQNGNLLFVSFSLPEIEIFFFLL